MISTRTYLYLTPRAYARGYANKVAAAVTQAVTPWPELSSYVPPVLLHLSGTIPIPIPIRLTDWHRGYATCGRSLLRLRASCTRPLRLSSDSDPSSRALMRWQASLRRRCMRSRS